MALVTDAEVAAERAVSSWWPSWRPTSDGLLEIAEKKLLCGLRSAIKSYFVPISNGNQIRTLEVNPKVPSKFPLLLLHGFGAGVALWSMNLDYLSQSHSVYAMDLLGFGRSTRPVFPSDAVEAEDMFVESIEEWREKMGIDKFILLGHSFGGYLAAAYSIKHANRVKHLILADPWGIPEKPPPGEENFKVPTWIKVIATLISPFNPLAAVRAVGPLGPRMVHKFRPDIQRKYSAMYGEEDTSVLDYIYHCNAQTPSGETAFKTLSIPYGFAKFPIIHRVTEIDRDLPMTVIYGSRSWMDTDQGYKIKHLRDDSKVDLHIIRGAGHHIYSDKPGDFNALVSSICDEYSDSAGSESEGSPLSSSSPCDESS